MVTTKRKVKRKKADPKEIEKRDYRKAIRSIFRCAGFDKVFSVSDREFTFKGSKSDFDDVFVYENIIVFIEYTTIKNISEHLKPKKIIYDLINNNKAEFIEFYEEEFPTFKEQRDRYYDFSQCKVIILYCAKNGVSKTHKDQVPGVVYLDYHIMKYFQNINDTIRLSARYELFSFLGLEYKNIGKEIINVSHQSDDFRGSILPHTYSNFDKGYKIVSFYIDPQSLLERSYVLRKEGWRENSGLYQRMILRKKINSIRNYLNEKERVFINNIIVTLPSETKIIDNEGNKIDPSTIDKTEPVIIQIPKGFNIIGLIDGQHRVFAYYEGGKFDEKIARLRTKQNLLVTGIIYPSKINEIDKTKFEANVFLEINSTQSNAKSELKHAIGLLLNPFSSESIAKAVLNRLNDIGPLENQFERHFYEKDKIKTSSIVSFGLKPIVKLSGEDSFYYIWENENKEELLKKEDVDLLDEYILFCVNHLNIFLSALSISINKTQWTTDRMEKNRVLSTAAINGLVICFRKMIENDKLANQEEYVEKLKEINSFDFSQYKSSQYSAMGKALFEEYFSV